METTHKIQISGFRLNTSEPFLKIYVDDFGGGWSQWIPKLVSYYFSTPAEPIHTMSDYFNSNLDPTWNPLEVCAPLNEQSLRLCKEGPTLHISNHDVLVTVELWNHLSNRWDWSYVRVRHRMGFVRPFPSHPMWCKMEVFLAAFYFSSHLTGHFFQ